MKTGFKRFSPEWWGYMTMPEPNTGCVFWMGSVCKEGYGRIAKSGGGSPVLVHRIAYEQANGPFDRSLKILHRCDMPSCVNPDHLFIGTQADNMRDMFAKRRARPAGRVPGAMDDQILSLRAAHPEMTQREIAAAVGTNQHTVWRILSANGIHSRRGPRPRATLAAAVTVKELALPNSNGGVIVGHTIHHMRSFSAAPDVSAPEPSWRHVTGVPKRRPTQALVPVNRPPFSTLWDEQPAKRDAVGFRTVATVALGCGGVR